VCAKCGSVVSRTFYEGVEQRAFEQRLPRTSGSYTNTMHDHGIGGTDIDIAGSRVKGSKSRWRSLKILHAKARTTKEEKIVEKALRHLNAFAKGLALPDYVKETAARLLRKTVAGHNYKDKTLKVLALASIYLALKIHGLAKPAKLFCREVGITSDKLWHAEKKIREANPDLSTLSKPPSPENYIIELASKLKLSHSAEKLAMEIVREYRDLGLDVGKPATGIAAASVYLASIIMNEKRTQQQVAEALGISDVSIRSRYGEMVEYLDITVYV